jgi:glyoxylate/hydroxypyruvate reductase A
MPENSPILLDIKHDSLRKSDGFTGVFADRRIIDLNNGAEHPAVFPHVKYAVVWKPDPSLFDRLPDLEVIFSVGAGVDHIFRLPMLPDVPVVRFVDQTLTTRMSEWICLQCLMHLRQQRKYDANQHHHRWQELAQPEAGEITVGIAGMGVLGQDAARKLAMLGFKVNGWSRSKKQIAGIRCYEGPELDAFLSETDFLIGLLPLTDATTGFFNRTVFSKLRVHKEIAAPVFINAGRGGSQHEADIISCLRDGTLGGVSLDVFETEPLANDSPLWDFDQAILTPHIAAVSDIVALGKHVHQQIIRHEAGLELQYLVDRSLGY